METPSRLQFAVPELRSVLRTAQGPVKQRDNDSRRHEAATTTKRVIEAARTAFLDAGDASTTIAVGPVYRQRRCARPLAASQPWSRRCSTTESPDQAASRLKHSAARASVEIRDPVERRLELERLAAEVTLGCLR